MSDFGTSAPAAPPSPASSSPFPAAVLAVQACFARAVASADATLFHTEAGDLYRAYLENLPVDTRQHHNCSCCRDFIRRFGSLATIDERGRIRSALWDGTAAPAQYRASFAAMEGAVAGAAVVGPFLSGEEVWGRPVTGAWTHFAVQPPSASVHGETLRTARQAMAAKREDFQTLSRALAEYGRNTVAQALTLLGAESLYRSEKVVGPARFLLDLHDAVATARGRAYDNVIWRAVASAPPGFCTPRSAMVGTLLDDLAAGMPFADVKRRFDAKMHPLQYQRPQTAPAAGTIAQAEKLVAAHGLERSLLRRFARLDELRTVWRPAGQRAPAAGGIFGHLRPKEATVPNGVDMPAQEITWTRFARTVLPGAQRMAVFTDAVMNFAGTLTCVDPDAPPILQWDRPDARNPFSSYVYPGGSSPAQWSLPANAWVDVTAIALLPAMWAGEDAYPHHGKGAILVLDGAKDVRRPGLCLFPETLRSDLHGIRAVVEAYSKTRQLEGGDEASANGLIVGQKGARPHRIRVTDAVGTACYRIDRWD